MEILQIPIKDINNQRDNQDTKHLGITFTQTTQTFTIHNTTRDIVTQNMKRTSASDLFAKQAGPLCHQILFTYIKRMYDSISETWQASKRELDIDST